MEGDLPWRSFAALTFNYGSGFLNGNGPDHLPSNYTFDLALGKTFGEKITVRLIGANITNNRYQLDNSNTFGGSHWADPRMLSVQVKYRFHYWGSSNRHCKTGLRGHAQFRECSSPSLPA